MSNKKNIFVVRKIKILSTMFILTFLLSACSVNFNTGGAKNATVDTGGVYKSIDRGVTWKQKSQISDIGGSKRNFSATNVNVFVGDPTDPKAFYYGSVDNGMAYTYDSAESWTVVKGLGATTINDIAIDPKSKCRIYVAISNKVFKTNDCSRHWEQTYVDNEARVKVNALAVNHFNDSIVYMGLSRGDFVQSSDYGASWKTIYRFNDNISKILIDPSDSRKIYVLTVKSGLYRSFDGGVNWENLNKTLSGVGIGNNIRDMVILNTKPVSIYIAGPSGIVKSFDDGDTFEKIELITPDKNSQINSVAVNEKDPNEIYYVTNTTFYKSSDAGVNWTPDKLPTIRAGWKIIINNEDPNILYMSFKSLKK